MRVSGERERDILARAHTHTCVQEPKYERDCLSPVVQESWEAEVRSFFLSLPHHTSLSLVDLSRLLT